MISCVDTFYKFLRSGKKKYNVLTNVYAQPGKINMKLAIKR